MAVRLETLLLNVLQEYLSPIMARSALRSAATQAEVDIDAFRPGDAERILRYIERALNLYCDDRSQARACGQRLSRAMRAHFELHGEATGQRRTALMDAWQVGRETGSSAPPIEARSAAGTLQHSTIPIGSEWDIVVARNTGRTMCSHFGFSASAQVKIATVISELARNILTYAQTGEIRLEVGVRAGRVMMEVQAHDHGPGIDDVEGILAGHYRSRTGLGQGLRGSKRLVDEFDVQTGRGKGTSVTTRTYLR